MMAPGTPVLKDFNELFVTKDNVDEKILFNNISLLAFDALHRRDYEAFDAHVGDTACQCRAFMLIDILSKFSLTDLMKFQGSDKVPQEYLILMMMFLTHFTRHQDPKGYDFIDTSQPEKLKSLSSKLGKKKCESINTRAQKELAGLSVLMTKSLLNQYDLVETLDANKRPLLDTSIHIRAIIKEAKKRSITLVIQRTFLDLHKSEQFIFERREGRYVIVPRAITPTCALCFWGEVTSGGVDEIRTLSITHIIKFNAENYKKFDPLPHTLTIRHVRAIAV